MTVFDEFKATAESAINRCTESLGQNRQTFPEGEELPSSVYAQVVQEHIGPLASVSGVADWWKSALEVVFRQVMFGMLAAPVVGMFEQLFDFLDLVLACSEQGYLDGAAPLTVVEEMLDVHPIDGCERIFEYIEKRKARLTAGMLPGRGKALVLLRMCNEMLRRLSKEKNTVFCGRVLMFLANSFPLCERSGVNLRGDFNVEPVIRDSDEEVDADPMMTDEQKRFYKLFWRTRQYFTNPPTIFQGDNFSELQIGGEAILEKFREIGRRDQAMTGSSSSSSESAGSKRKRADDDIDMESNPDLAQQMLDEIKRNYRFPRLLSSRRLLELEIEDTRVRRGVIVQFLILFQYLLGFSQEEKERTQKLLSARGATKQSLVQPSFTLEGDQLKWVIKMQEDMIDLLKQTKPHGELYTEIILTLLAHERNWIVWKASGCPAFEKPALDINALRELWQRKRPRVATALAPYRYAYGNPEMTNLYGKERPDVRQVMKTRSRPPKPVQVIDAALSRLENEATNASSNERFEIANGALFQATRLMFQSQASLIPKVYSIKKEIYKTMKEEAKASAEKAEEDSTKKAADSTDEKSEQHVETEIKVLKAVKELLVD